MSLRNEWEGPQLRNVGLFSEFGMSAVRVTLLFGSAAVGLALLLTPVVEEQVGRMVYAPYAGKIDPMTTGAIMRGAANQDFDNQRSGSSYVVRRSVLQPTPSSVCIAHNNGSRIGNC